MQAEKTLVRRAAQIATTAYRIVLLLDWLQ
jgi:hypothetical protein